MASAEHKEAMTSYYFYRLLARAKRVYMLYCTQQQGIGSSEPSRYIAQLTKIYNLPIKHHSVNSKLVPSYDYTINLPKDDFCRQKIEKYHSDDTDTGYLSASSINELIACQLKFALHHIYGLNDETDKGDFMDSGTMGTIAHDTLKELYYPDGTEGPYIVDEQMIKSFRANLGDEVTRQINMTYLHLPDEELNTTLSGDSKLQKVTIQLLVEQVIDYDLNLLKKHHEKFFEVIECESTHYVRLKADDVEFKFQFRADRIDRIGGKGPVRIIDYKTGSDKTSATNVESLFNNAKGRERPKAIVQLILYCMAWEKDSPLCDTDVIPVIYKLQNMNDSGAKFSNKQRKPQEQITLKSMRADGKLDEFCEYLGSQLRILFDSEAKFNQCPPGIDTCNYCRFISLCKRQIKENKY